MRVFLIILTTFLINGNLFAAEGTRDYVSNYSVDETLDRLEASVKAKGMTVFARIDHAAGARRVGLELRPTELLIFGNPKIGTRLMQSNQQAGIDLPVKALAWADANGTVRLTINSPDYLTRRHCINDQQAVVDKMTAALEKFAQGATR